MFIRCLRQALACVALLWAVAAGAVTVSGLYSAEIKVSSAGVPPAAGQVTDGLAQVMIKLSGSRDVVTQTGYGSVLLQAQELMREYTYRTSAEGEHWLQLSYDQAQLDALLQDVGIRGLGQQRPALLLWLVQKQAGSAEDYMAADHPAMQALMAQAKRRGLALQLPLLDLQDFQQLSPEQLWQSAPDAVRRASQRYSPDAVLAGRVWSEGGFWFSEFELEGTRWETQRFALAGELDEQMTQVIDAVADSLLTGFVAAPVDYRPAGLVLQVEGVSGQADYLMLVERLRQSEGVTAVFPERISPGRLYLRLQLDTSVEQLEQTLRLDNRLEPVGRLDAAGVKDTGLLQYRWQN
ncbi:DUF2066 domain-containing protein [Marinobacterium rhizophilum]|uniref:DUF2066 domain-containing protein n=1 Tax=Marinobacterium rhizophilum TaxID=420402 RepID=UPI00037C36E9|nr:DUF2066 domain-containing protein [Marinobacterium rhizophilum]